MYLFAINNQGKASFPAVVTYDVPKPNAPEPITFQEVPIGVKIIAPNFPNNCHRMLLRIEGNTNSITTNTYIYQGDAGIFKVTACYVDLFGEGAWSIEYQMTVNPVFKPEWIADESISLEKMDSVIKKAVKDAQESVPRLNGIDTKIEGINTDIEGINTDIEGINTDIEGINTDILNINGDITELVKADGEIRTTITETNQATNERFASELKQTADGISSTVAKNKADQDDVNESLASQITQTASEINATIESKESGLRSDISKVSLKADGISSTVAKNKTDQDGVNETLASQITQTASEINATIESKESGLRSDISKVSLKADGISSTVAKNKADQDDVNESLASQITQTASEVKTTLQNQIDGINADISQIQQTAESLSTTVQKNKKSTDTEISNIKQTADSLSTTVQNNKKAADDSIEGLSSQISQQADRITSVVTELGKSPDKCAYSAITQLQSGINLRVAKTDFNGQNIVNQINLSPQGTLIDGKYLHVTGTTKFDNDVIVGGMIKAGAISGEKIAANAVTAEKINVKSLSAITANIGTLRTRESGARVEISDDLIQVFDGNNRLRVRLGVWS